jgi:hypothetical protein
MIGFINSLVTRTLLFALRYSAISDLHTPYTPLLHAHIKSSKSLLTSSQATFCIPGSTSLASVTLNCLNNKVKVTLRLTVIQPVSLGVEPNLGLMAKYKPLLLSIFGFSLSNIGNISVSMILYDFRLLPA